MIPPLTEGQSVPEGFRLPWNMTRTMADVWELTPLDINVERFRYHVTPVGDQPRERVLPLPREIEYVAVEVR